jgi:hypothetical protein
MRIVQVVWVCTVLLLGLVMAGWIARAAPPARQPESTPASDLPDLRVAMARTELETGDDCAYTAPDFGVAVWIVNLGLGEAGPVGVEINGETYRAPDGLPSGQQIRIWARTSLDIRVAVDSQTEVLEQNEHNNMLVDRLPVPRLPAPCTPTPIVTPNLIPSTTTTPTSTSEPPRVAPQNFLPPDGAVIYLPFPTLSAERVGIETIYDIRSGAGENVASLRSGGMGTVLEYGPTALPEGRYQWSAFGCRLSGCSPSSASWTFTMRGEMQTPVPTITPTPLPETLLGAVVGEVCPLLAYESPQWYGDRVTCTVATGHWLTIQISSVDEPLPSDDERSVMVQGYPGLYWKEPAPNLMAASTQRVLVWQVGNRTIRIEAVDDTGIPVAPDPLEVAERIYPILQAWPE